MGPEGERAASLEPWQMLWLPERERDRQAQQTQHRSPQDCLLLLHGVSFTPFTHSSIQPSTHLSIQTASKEVTTGYWTRCLFPGCEWPLVDQCGEDRWLVLRPLHISDLQCGELQNRKNCTSLCDTNCFSQMCHAKCFSRTISWLVIQLILMVQYENRLSILTGILSSHNNTDMTWLTLFDIF